METDIGGLLLFAALIVSGVASLAVVGPGVVSGVVVAATHPAALLSAAIVGGVEVGLAALLHFALPAIHAAASTCLHLPQQILACATDFALKIRQDYSQHIDPVAELFVGVGTICAVKGEQGFEAFMNALGSVYSSLHDWAKYMEDELKGLKDKMIRIEQIIRESKAEDKYKDIEEELKQVSAKTWELVTTANLINNGGDPEVVEEKKQKAREIGRAMLGKAEEIQGLMDDPDRPFGLPVLDLSPFLDTSSILERLPDAPCDLLI